MTQTILTAVMTLLLINSSYGSLRRLSEAEGRRRLIPVSIHNKLCIDFTTTDINYIWKHKYNGDYTYQRMENGKPSYQMTTCRDRSSWPTWWPQCQLGSKLSYAANGKWQFGSQTNDPFCWTETETPQDCHSWWDDNASPTITECGSDQTVENGVSQQATDEQTACSKEVAAGPHYDLTQSDKDLLLKQFNDERKAHGQSDWTWSPALEAVAVATTLQCTAGHPVPGTEMVRICKTFEPVDPNCWAAATQGTGGPNQGYDARHFVSNCPGLGGNGIVKSFMTDDHRRPMTGEEDTATHKYTKVACAVRQCPGGGVIACNYM